jgi:DNA-binding protein HU-beta
MAGPTGGSHDQERTHRRDLPGFISFEQTHRKARTARNPQTGAAIQVPATNAAKVSAGAKLKASAKAGV